jgi:enamine deaminase RidA (YjgF/YER057c/UK114 family)
MTIKKVVSPKLPEPPGGIYSNCLVVGDQIFLAGMTAGGPDGKAIGGNDAYLQSKAALEKIRVMLEAAGASVADIVKMTVYLTDISKRPDFGRARTEFFGEPKPCSTLIAVAALAQPDMMVEVDVTAIRGASRS